MTEQYAPNVGYEPGPDARRDAFHVPVAPMVAGEELYVGMNVELQDMDDGEGKKAYLALPNSCYAVGLVDPLLARQGVKTVKKDQRFWLWLYPGTVESLRHAWSHPAFRTEAPHA